MAERTIEIFESKDALAAAATRAFSEALTAAEGSFSVALAGGSTPKDLYARLAAQPDLPWDKARLFLGDERALPKDHADSNRRMVEDLLARPLGLTETQVILPDGGAEDLEAEAARYAATMVDVLGDPPALDVALLGMGGDGHTASLFPGEPEPSGWYAAARAPAETAASRRLTLTPAALVAAKQVWLFVAGAGKAERLADVISGRDPGPLARLIAARTLETRWFLDTEAARHLKETS